MASTATKDVVMETAAEEPSPTINAADTMVIKRDDLVKMLEAAADQAVNKARLDFLGASSPPKALRAQVADGFIKDGEQTPGEVLRNYRVDGVLAMKVAELDMDRLAYYEENTDDLPNDSFGHPVSPRHMAFKKGQFINIMNGRVAARSENQITQLEWMKTLPDVQGGLPGLYQVSEEVDLWQCTTCVPFRPFRNKQDWESHREATHGIPREDVPNVASL